MTTVLCVPQWQGSSAEQAPRLMDGARRAADLMPADVRRVTVPVLEEAGPIEEGVRALSVLVENLRRTSEALSGIDDQVLTIGGDCGVDLAPLAAARARYGAYLTVLWIDAHPDLFATPTIPSFHGMILRTLLGDGPAPLVPAEPLAPEQVVLAGTRAGDPTELACLAELGLRRHGVEELEQAFEGLTGPVYAHVDLDVLEPTEFASTCYPEPNGVSADRLAALLSGVDGLVGGALTEHAPAPGENPREAEIIRRLGAAMVR